MSEYQTLLDRLQLPQGKAATFLGITRRTSNSYARGRPVPVPVIKLLRTAIGLVELIAAYEAARKKRKISYRAVIRDLIKIQTMIELELPPEMIKHIEENRHHGNQL